MDWETGEHVQFHDREQFLQHPETKLMATCDHGEMWVFQERVAFFLSNSDDSISRLTPNAAVRPIMEQSWTVVDEDLLSKLVALIGRSTQ